MKLRDKKGQLIQVGDVLKIFHFVGRRGKYHYMYKQVMGTRQIGDYIYFEVSHLSLTPESYMLLDELKTREDTEIVQSLTGF